MSAPELDLEVAGRELETLHPQAILDWAFALFDRIALSFSGAEDVVLIHMAAGLRARVPVFVLDTGRLHPETYQFIEEVRSRYALDLDILTPEAMALQALVREKGLFSFYRDGHQECCGVRKVAPLKRKLATLDAWVTGQRKDQSPETRAAVPVVQIDPAFSTPDHGLAKLNPLANWRSAEVWRYIRENDLPFNALHRRGFVSIGCEPCTRPVLPEQHEREGRWWWEDVEKKECGLHRSAALPAKG